MLIHLSIVMSSRYSAFIPNAGSRILRKAPSKAGETSATSEAKKAMSAEIRLTGVQQKWRRGEINDALGPHHGGTVPQGVRLTGRAACWCFSVAPRH